MFEVGSDKDSSGPENKQLVCMASLVTAGLLLSEVDLPGNVRAHAWNCTASTIAPSEVKGVRIHCESAKLIVMSKLLAWGAVNFAITVDVRGFSGARAQTLPSI
eukprot:1144448-Pelagomonas_calceolata.AAC.4